MIVVVNTSPLIALDRIGQLNILQRMFTSIVRPQSVVDELRAGQAAHSNDSKRFGFGNLTTSRRPEEAEGRLEGRESRTPVFRGE